MRLVVYILLISSALVSRAQQLYVSGDAILYIAPDARLEVTGDLENDGTILNTGTLALFGNWPTNNIFNGLTGTLQFLGGQDQVVSPNTLTVNRLNLDQSGEVDILSNEFIVTDEIRFTNGVVRVRDSTRFILESGVRVIGGSITSYFQGRLTQRGSGIKRFPMGYEGFYSPITLTNVFGVDPEISVLYERPNEAIPVPDDDVLGVSAQNIWEVELNSGTTSGTPVEIAFSGEDLENFEINNRIRHRVNSPIITVSDAPDGTFRSLGVETLESSDSLSFGTITSELDFVPEEGQKAYFAIGLAPRIDPNGLVYIPEIFSPAATDPDNQTFRIFGERILDENFRLEIYNRFGALVFSTQSFAEANQLGWDGVNQRTGREEPSGLYFYQVVLTRISGQIEEYQGPFYLQR